MDKSTFNKRLVKHDNQMQTEYFLNTQSSCMYYFEVTSIKEYIHYYPEILTQSHTHHFYLIIWFWSGTGIHIVDSNEYDIHPGRLFFLGPKHINGFRNLSGESGVVFTFHESFFNLVQERLSDFIKFEIFHRIGKCVYCDSDSNSDIILNRIIDNINTDINESDKMIQHYIMSVHFTNFILQAQRRCVWSQNVRRKIDSQSYQTFLDFIALVEAEFQKKHDVYWYARKLGISKALLSRYVKMYDSTPNHDLTPLKIINLRIMEEIIKLLKHSTNSLNQIANSLGFSDNSNFTKFFKHNDPQKRTPSEYRNNWQEERELD
ncbi:helix-turn-helix domain-containing protein [Prevotella sp. SGI.027]